MKKGQSLVEFAIVLTIFLTIMLGIIEWGIYLYSLSTISNATRDAVRMAVIIENINNEDTLKQLKKEVTRQSSPLSKRLRDNIEANTAVILSPEDSLSPEYITIQVMNLDYQPLTGFKVFIPKTISTRATMRYERKK